MKEMTIEDQLQVSGGSVYLISLAAVAAGTFLYQMLNTGHFSFPKLHQRFR